MIAGTFAEVRGASEPSVTILPMGREGKVTCFVCVVVAFQYALALRPALGRWGLACRCTGVLDASEVADFAIACIVLALVTFLNFFRSGTMPLPRARRLTAIYTRALLLLFAAASAKLGWLCTGQGRCGLCELFWYLIFIVLSLFASPEAKMRSERLSKAEAEAEAGRALAGLRSLSWTAEDVEVGRDPEVGQLEPECVICLSEWEADDVVKITPCKHAFHQECLQAWLARQLRDGSRCSCAMCRRELGASSGSEAEAARGGDILSPSSAVSV